jgi:NAD+ kinase
MATVAIVLNESRPRAVELAHEAAAWLKAQGHPVRIPDDEAAAVGLTEHACPPELLGPGADLAVSLGGDGTILRTVGMVAHHQVPVLGVNVGRLGYLAHVEPEALCRALERFTTGDYQVEERLLLCVRIDPGPGADGRSGPGESGNLLALNEAVVEKPSAGQVVHVGVSIDGRFFTNYAADGMIVATPTGSTAYAFSARGPIIDPAHRALLLTPVSPHMAFDRSLVFGAGQTLRLEVLDRPALLIVDGRELGRLQPGSAITCEAAREVARFVTLGTDDFYGVLKAKFGLADR